MNNSPLGDGQHQFLAIARVVALHGIHGEMRAEIITDFPERFAGLKTICVGQNHDPYEVVSTRPHKRQVLIRLKGVETAEVAEKLRGEYLSVPSTEAVVLETGQYYWHQIIGSAVLTTDGRHLGRVTDILRTGSNDVYVVRSGSTEILVPAIEDVIREVDPAGKRLIIEPLPGMLE